MKLILATLLLILLLSACGGSQPNPTATTWDNAKWNESIWEE